MKETAPKLNISNAILTETKEGGLEGFIDQYLDQVYLPGYYLLLQKEHPHLVTKEANGKLTTSIPEIINRIWAPFLREYKDKIGTINIFGEVGRAMADRMNSFYWQHFAQLQEEMEDVRKNTSNPLVREFCDSSLSFPHDPDIDIVFRTDLVKKISKMLKNVHAVSQNNVITEGQNKEKYDLFETEEYKVSVATAPLITRPQVVLMVISIYDKYKLDDEGKPQRVFHLDVGSFPQEAQDAFLDKRVVYSINKQDIGQAELSERNNRLYATISSQARQVMRGTSEVKTKDYASELELATRNMRIEASHPVDKNLNFLERFMPQMDSASTFAMREIFRRGTKKEVNQAIMFFTIKELILSLRYDPYQTVEMLRDSGVLANTMLANLTPFDFDAILKSNSFSIEMENMVPIPFEKRDEAYVKKQRQLYREPKAGHPDQQSYTDGLKRFINALVEVGILDEAAKEDYWGTFFTLIMEKNISPIKIENYKTREKITVSSMAKFDIDGQKLGLVSLDDKPLNERVIENAAEFIQMRTSGLPEGITPRTDAIMRTYEHAQNTQLGNEIQEFVILDKKRNLTEQQLIRRAELKNKIYSLTDLYLLLKKYPSGLTPRELERLYEKKKGSFSKLPYAEILAEFKRLGFVVRYAMDRVHQTDQDIVEVDLYFLMPESASTHNLEILINNLSIEERRQMNQIYELLYFQYFANRKTDNGENMPQMNLTTGEIITILKTHGVSLEALESFSEKDFEEYNKQGWMNELFAYNIKLFRESLRRIFALRYLQDLSAPIIYKTTFSSVEGRSIIKDCRQLLASRIKEEPADYQI